MPYQGRAATTYTLNGITFPSAVNVTGDSHEGASVSVPAAKVGELTTRSDNDDGVVTMVTGHGFSTSDKIDVFWSGGTRRNMTATVTGDSVALVAGSGDDLPAVDTAVTAMKPTEVALDIDGDAVVALACKSPRNGWVVFVEDDGGPADIADATFRIPAGGAFGWVDGAGGDNPLAGTAVIAVKFSHGDSSAAREMVTELVYN